MNSRLTTGKNNTQTTISWKIIAELLYFLWGATEPNIARNGKHSSIWLNYKQNIDLVCYKSLLGKGIKSLSSPVFTSFILIEAFLIFNLVLKLGRINQSNGVYRITAKFSKEIVIKTLRRILMRLLLLLSSIYSSAVHASA